MEECSFAAMVRSDVFILSVFLSVLTLINMYGIFKLSDVWMRNNKTESDKILAKTLQDMGAKQSRLDGGNSG